MGIYWILFSPPPPPARPGGDPQPEPYSVPGPALADFSSRPDAKASSSLATCLSSGPPGLPHGASWACPLRKALQKRPLQAQRGSAPSNQPQRPIAERGPWAQRGAGICPDHTVRQRCPRSPSCPLLWHVHKGGRRAEPHSRVLLACDGAVCALSQLLVKGYEVLFYWAYQVAPACPNFQFLFSKPQKAETTSSKPKLWSQLRLVLLCDLRQVPSLSGPWSPHLSNGGMKHLHLRDT